MFKASWAATRAGSAFTSSASQERWNSPTSFAITATFFSSPSAIAFSLLTCKKVEFDLDVTQEIEDQTQVAFRYHLFRFHTNDSNQFIGIFILLLQLNLLRSQFFFQIIDLNKDNIYIKEVVCLAVRCPHIRFYISTFSFLDFGYDTSDQCGNGHNM